MKKIITMAALFTFGLAVAQEKSETEQYGFTKGNLFVEGQINISSEKGSSIDEGVEDYERKTTMTNFTPKIGYLITDRFAAGVGLSYGNNKVTTTELLNDGQTTRETQKTNGFGAEVFARYYFLKLGKRFHSYSELNAGFLTYNIDEIEDDVTSSGKMKTANVGFDIGINYFLTPKLAVSFTAANILEYNTYKIEGDEVDSSAKTSSFSVNLNVFKNFFQQPTFGLLYNF